MQLLFTLAEFHGLAKLRQHTDHTLAILDNLTSTLGDQLRSFVKNTCSKFDTKELAREYQARMRCQARKNQTGTVQSKRRKTASGKASTAQNPEDPGMYSTVALVDKVLNLCGTRSLVEFACKQDT